METERLILRPWRDEDAPQLLRNASRSSPRAAYVSGKEKGFGPWAAIDKATGTWIGRVGLDHLEDGPGDDKIEVGFELRQAWWGRGLATEGALAALRFGFEHGLPRIISITATDHAAARRVMEKAGLTYQGTRTWMNPNVLVVWYAIDRATWDAART